MSSWHLCHTCIGCWFVLSPCCRTTEEQRAELQGLRSTDGTIWRGILSVEPVFSDWNLFSKTVHSWPPAPLTLICPKEDATILSVKFILESHSIRSLFLDCAQCFMSTFDKHEITFSKVKKTKCQSVRNGLTTVSVSLADLELLYDSEVNDMSLEKEFLDRFMIGSLLWLWSWH